MPRWRCSRIRLARRCHLFYHCVPNRMHRLVDRRSDKRDKPFQCCSLRFSGKLPSKRSRFRKKSCSFDVSPFQDIWMGGRPFLWLLAMQSSDRHRNQCLPRSNSSIRKTFLGLATRDRTCLQKPVAPLLGYHLGFYRGRHFCHVCATLLSLLLALQRQFCHLRQQGQYRLGKRSQRRVARPEF